MIAVSKLAETYKPVVSEGSTKDLVIKIVLEVLNVDSVSLKIDPNVVVATKGDIENLDIKITENTMQLSEKASLYISEILPAIADREEKTMYLKITDTINSGGTDNIQVSPTMGIKIV